LGSCEPPNTKSTMTSTMMSSLDPKFMGSA
jgi:hypothetical protein